MQDTLTAIILVLLATSVVVFSSYPTFQESRRLLVQVLKKCIGHPGAVNDGHVDKFGGWLFLWWVTASILSLKIIVGLVSVLPPFAGDLWDKANDPFSRGYPLWKVLLLFGLISRTALLCTGAVVGIGFLRRRHYVPKLIVGFLLAYLLIAVGQKLLMVQIFQPTESFFVMVRAFWSSWHRDLLGRFSNFELTLALIACLIWIPYFLLSKRVNDMFGIPQSQIRSWFFANMKATAMMAGAFGAIGAALWTLSTPIVSFLCGLGGLILISKGVALLHDSWKSSMDQPRWP